MSDVNQLPRGITAEVVLAFMRERAKEFSKKVPGYVFLKAEVSEGIKGTAYFRAYGEHLGWSQETSDPAIAIEEIVAKSEGKTESELLRRNAAEMIARAEKLEKGGAQ